jgi:organic radical activating enzyme
MESVFPVMEHFYTIHGEGAFTGVAAYFIRLAGCDVGCTWCDVKESWNAEGYPIYSAAQMFEWVSATKAKVVVITGGEPAMYDLNPIVDTFHQNGIRVHIETSGAYEIQGNFDWITLSPKKFKFPIESEIPKAHELKIVAFNNSDFEWATKWEHFCNASCKLYIQPEWDKREKMIPAIIDFVKENPHWQISLQTHKIINVP